MRGLATCWCGAELPDEVIEEMAAEASGRCCGGGGEINCYCGGDFCCCHNHGSVPCPGCIDCLADADDDGPEWDGSRWVFEEEAGSDHPEREFS